MTFNSAFKHYCEVSSCSGVIDCYQSNSKIGKIFWLILIFSGLGLTLYQVHDVFHDYFNNGKGSFRSKVDRLPMNADFIFPSITICNFNRAMNSKLIKDNIDQRILEYSYAVFPISYDLAMRTLVQIPSWNENKTIYEDLWRNYSNGNQPDIGQMLRRYGHDCNSTVIRLRFKLFDKLEADACKYLQEVLTTYGRCWVYRTNESQGRPGPGGGAQLVLNVALDEYPENLMVNNFLEQGIIISIGYEYEPEPTDPIIVQPGYHAYISMSATAQIYKSEQYQMFPMNCRKDTELKYVNANYTPSNCRLECLANSTFTHYGCVPLLEPKGTYRTCTPNETISLIYPYIDGDDDYWKKQGPEIRDSFHNCENTCINACDQSITITSSTTMAKKNLRSQEEEGRFIAFGLKGTGGVALDDTILEDLVRIDIYFPVLQYINIEISEETPVFRFISDVGGLLGVYTGICILSLFQAIYYVILAAIRFICEKINNNKITIGLTKVNKFS